MSDVPEGLEAEIEKLVERFGADRTKNQKADLVDELMDKFMEWHSNKQETNPEMKFTIGCASSGSDESSDEETRRLYDLEEDAELIKEDARQTKECEILKQLSQGSLKLRDLEKALPNDTLHAVQLRREHLGREKFENLPVENYNYDLVLNSCCENVVGHVPVPVGIAGPLTINDRPTLLPLATTEGALVASVNRGCAVLTRAGGVKAKVWRDGMTRAPVIRCETAGDACELAAWLARDEVVPQLKTAFNSTSNYARLQSIEVLVNDVYVFPRFTAVTGDAMGMNMVSKGVAAAMRYVEANWPRWRDSKSRMVAVSGNVCADKKAASINWIKGRGKSVIAEAVIPPGLIKQYLKVDVDALVEVAKAKLDVGSEVAGALGGKNAHAANMVAAMFLATGQDVAQVVSSSMCTTRLTKTEDGRLHISCSMNCMEVGTIGGGTILPAQKQCLQLLECAGPCAEEPGRNARRLAECVASAVVAGELSLLASLAANSLVESHLRLNRSIIPLSSTSTLTVSQPVPTPMSIRDEGRLRGGDAEDSGLIRLDSKKSKPKGPECSNIL